MLPAVEADTEYTAYVDADADAATGCSVSDPGTGASLSGMEARVIARVDDGGEVSRVTRETCDTGLFAGPALLGGGYPIASDAGVDGGDAIEFSASLEALGGASARSRLAFAARGATGADVMAAGSGDNPVVIGPAGGVSPTAIPGLGPVSAMLFFVAVAAAGSVALRRRPALAGSAAAVAIAGSAIAAQFAADGRLGDWTNVAPAVTDGLGDAGGDNAADLIAAFVAQQQGRLFVRLDAVDVENEVPSAAATRVTLSEDGGATSIALSGTDPQGAPLSFAVVSTPSLGSLGGIAATGPDSATVTFTPAPDANGSDAFAFTVDDGTDVSPPATVSVDIAPVNDAPSLAVDDPPQVVEGAGPQRVADFAQFDPGPADEAEQGVSAYRVSDVSDATAFAQQPAVDAAGTLTYEAAPDANGTLTFDLAVRDDGGTANGGEDTSAPATVSIDITPVNDAPGFTPGGDVTSAEDAGTRVVAGWASDIDPGADNEAGQTLTFNVVRNTNPGLFSDGPSVDPVSGDLSYAAAPNANGSAEITLELADDGGTAQGGEDTSPAAVFTITVTPVNDPPAVAAPGPFEAVGNVRIQVPDGDDDLLSGAADTVDGSSALPLTIDAYDSTSAAGGTVGVDASSGAFSYDPPPGFEGTDSFDYTVCDSGAPGSACTEATVSVNVSGLVWFVDPSAGAGDGRLTSPFNDVDALNAVNDGGPGNPQAGDAVFLYAGTHDGRLALLDGQAVIGAGASTALANAAGLSVPAYSDPLPATGGTPPTWTANEATAVSVAANNLLQGFEIGSTGGGGIDIAGNGFGTLAIAEMDLTGTGQALDLVNGTLSASGGFGIITSLSGGHNIRLIDVDGSLSAVSGELSGSSSDALVIDGGNAAFRYGGRITNTVGRVIDVRNKSGGAAEFFGDVTSNTSGEGIHVAMNGGGTRVRFDGSAISLATGNSRGVALTDNPGAIIDFTGGSLDIQTSGATGFYAANSGTVTLTGGPNVVSAATATAVAISDTAIGGAGVEFTRVSVNGAPSGLVLENTLGGGPFRVTGDGTTGPGISANNDSGGTILNTTGDGIRLTNTASVSLDQMRVENAADHGIHARGVSGLTATRFNLIGNGDADQEHGLRWLNGTGDVTVANTLADGNYDAHVRLLRQAGGDLGRLTVMDSTLRNVTTGFFGDGVSFELRDGTNGDITVTGNTFANHDGDHVQASSNGASEMDVVVTNNTMTGSATNLGAGITVNSANSFSGTTTFDIRGNDIQKGNDGSASINVNVGSSTASGRYTGRIENNVIGTQGVADSGGDTGVAVEVNRDATMTVAVTGNTVREFDNLGICAGAVDAISGPGALNLTVTGNTVTSADANAFAAMYVDAQTTNSICADIGGATSGLENAFSASVGFSDVALRTGGSGTIELAGYSGAQDDASAIEAYVQGRNSGTPTVAIDAAGDAIQGGGPCPVP